jgi:hypothetical protein
MEVLVCSDNLQHLQGASGGNLLRQLTGGCDWLTDDTLSKGQLVLAAKSLLGRRRH